MIWRLAWLVRDEGERQLMKHMARWLGLAALACTMAAQADDARVEFAEFFKQGDDTWSVSVTLRHADTGWDHYADAWRVLGADDTELGRRVLYHPHEDEQPFTRSLSGVKIPAGMTSVWVQAHDKVHGWSPNRLKIDLGKAIDGHLKVNAE